MQKITKITKQVTTARTYIKISTIKPYYFSQ